MQTWKLILLGVTIPIIIIIFSLLIVLITRLMRQKKNANQMNEIRVFIEPERIKRVEIMLQRISVIAKSNKKYEKLFDILSKEFDSIESMFKLMNKDVLDLQKRYLKLRQKEFEIRVEKIKTINETFARKIASSKKKANNILKQEEFLRNEVSLFREKTRTISSSYSKKRITLDKISGKIDILNKRIAGRTRKFDSLIQSGETRSASEIIEKLREDIIQFGIIINEGPKIQATLYGAIPKFIKKLIVLFNHAQNKLKVDLSHIDFHASIRRMANNFETAKSHFLELRLEESKKEIIFIIKNIKAIERMINSEIKSRNIFVNEFINVQNLVLKTMKQFVQIRKEVKKMPQSGTRLSVEMMDIMRSLKFEIADLDENAMSFSKLMKDKNIPYTSKLSRMKILLNKNISAIKLMNSIYELIWRDDIAKRTVQNQFMQVEHALISLRAKVIDKNILLSIAEEQQLQDIEETKVLLKTTLTNEPFNSNVAKQQVRRLIENVTSYYKVVGGKIAMARMVRNLIKEFAPNRAMNAKLNISLVQAEKQYLAGEYASSLRIAIDAIEELLNIKRKRK
ncbi:septation ring formation regulator EzrA [Mycoplasma marinum]|nr:septation ring formation regulator EzrA [Mycoplasma marinum]